jgi:hypothetical protein
MCSVASSHGKGSTVELPHCNSADTPPREASCHFRFSEIFDPKEGRLIMIFSQMDWVQYIFGYENIHVALGFCVAEHPQCVDKHVRPYDLSYLEWIIVCTFRI